MQTLLANAVASSIEWVVMTTLALFSLRNEMNIWLTDFPTFTLRKVFHIARFLYRHQIQSRNEET